MHIHYHIYCSFAHSWLHPLPFVLTIMMPDVPLHPHGIPLQEFNEQMMMERVHAGHTFLTVWPLFAGVLNTNQDGLQHMPRTR